MVPVLGLPLGFLRIAAAVPGLNRGGWQRRAAAMAFVVWGHCLVAAAAYDSAAAVHHDLRQR